MRRAAGTRSGPAMPSACAAFDTRPRAPGKEKLRLASRRRASLERPAMNAPDRLGFGIFLAPFHPVGENPTTALHRDLELIEWLDRLGYDEAWFGEHHSAGLEIIASPEVFIAAAAACTGHIRLGTEVSWLPCHPPVKLPDRMALRDHLPLGPAMVVRVAG